MQIAGVVDAEDAALVAACGVDFLGFPLGLEVDRGDCSEAEARRIIAQLPAAVEPVLITYRTEPAEVAALAHGIGVRWVQLHGAVEPAGAARLRRSAPELRLVRTLVVRGQDLPALERSMREFTPHVDAFLTDSFDPRTGASGATGRTHDWAISRSLAARSPRPLVLAGGLTPENVRRAILEVRPAAVDAHTGVEGLDGRKSRELVSRFVAEARAAFAALGAPAPPASA